MRRCAAAAADWAVHFFLLPFIVFFCLLIKSVQKNKSSILFAADFPPQPPTYPRPKKSNTSFLNRGRRSSSICILPPFARKKNTGFYNITAQKNKVPGSLCMCRRRLDTIWPKIRWMYKTGIHKKKKEKKEEKRKKTRPLKSERIPPPGGGRMREKCLNGPIAMAGTVLSYARAFDDVYCLPPLSLSLSFSREC